jgi:peptidoglycan-N-acetylglucosamine deacetylase
MLMNRLVGALLLTSLCIPVRQRMTPASELWAFTGPWDASSDSSLRMNAGHLDVAVTGWIGLDSVTAQPILPALFPDTIHLPRAGLRRMAIVTSWHGDRFHPGSIRALASDDARLGRAASAIANHAAMMHYAGLVLDFESLDARDLPGLLRVVRAITDSAHAHGVSTIAVAIPAVDAAYPAKPIAGVADLIMPMLYDQHWSTSGPGAISSPDWVRSALARRIEEVGASRIVAALPTYGYRWSSKTKTPAEVVSFADARRIAVQDHIPLARDAKSSTLRAVKPGEWEMWVSDAELLATLARQVHDAGVRRVALWRIGHEDPHTWRALAR